MLRLLFTACFSLLFWASYAQFETVGIIGTATPQGWDASTPMDQDPEDENIWRLEIELEPGLCKFRANNAWDVNWGDTKFPIGTGTQNGPDISVIGGNYIITFNSETGAYFFDYQDSNFGVIGNAIPLSNWGRDIFMFQDGDEYFIELDMVPGAFKFRENSDWDTNWGGDGLSGIAIFDGPDINIANTGYYRITFNRATLEYNVEEQVEFETIGLIGSATPGGWDEDTPLERDPFNPSIWSTTVVLEPGLLKFRANNDWAVNWGGDSFPAGAAVPGGNDIVVSAEQAGTYLATLNLETLEYRFLEIVAYDQIGILGSSTPGGYETLTLMQNDPNNVSIWTLRTTLVAGDLFFAVDETFVNEIWGGSTFPSGTAVMDASLGIPAEAGEYRIRFNTTTGEYNFELIVEYGAVSLVGASGPFGRWPDDTDAFDYYLDKDAEDGNIWTGNGIELIDYDPNADGGIKFRAEAAWATNWGAVDFPEGVGVQNGPNIQPTAGTWSVVFNSATGEYAFGPAVSTRDEMLNPGYITLMPNPASSEVTVRIDFPHFKDMTMVSVFDVSGRTVMSQNFDNFGDIKLNVAQLQPGTYFVHIKNGQYFLTKKLNVIK